LESEAGQKNLSSKINNHFGIKCFSKSCTNGHCSNQVSHLDSDFYRAYENAWASFRGHSLLIQNQRYQHLQDLGTKNYVAWAQGLQEAGYSPDPHYAKKIIMIIEYFELTQFDE